MKRSRKHIVILVEYGQVYNDNSAQKRHMNELSVNMDWRGMMRLMRVDKLRTNSGVFLC